MPARLSLLVAVLCLLALPASAAAAERTVPPRWVGAMADGPMTDPNHWLIGDWDLMAKSGVETVRTAFYWPYAQPTEGGAMDFSRYDFTVLSAAREGLPVLPVIEGTPSWAATNPDDRTTPPRDPELLAAFMRALVARYGPGGSFWAEHPELKARPIREWQIGNEPHLTLYFTPPPGQGYARAYVATLRAASTAVRRADPGAKIILAGLTNESWKVLRKLYKAGARRYFDVVAMHPYTGKPANVVKILRLARKEMRKAGDRRKPLWVTEFGWAASQGKEPTVKGITTTDKGQARRLRAVIRMFARARRELKIGRVYWYTWLSEEGAHEGNQFEYAGLRRIRDGSVISTPALGVFRAQVARLYGR